MTEHAQKFGRFFYYYCYLFIYLFFYFLLFPLFECFRCFLVLVRYPDDMSTQQAVEDDEIEGDREEEEVGYS